MAPGLTGAHREVGCIGGGGAGGLPGRARGEAIPSRRPWRSSALKVAHGSDGAVSRGVETGGGGWGDSGLTRSPAAGAAPGPPVALTPSAPRNSFLVTVERGLGLDASAASDLGGRQPRFAGARTDAPPPAADRSPVVSARGEDWEGGRVGQVWRVKGRFFRRKVPEMRALALRPAPAPRFPGRSGKEARR